MSKQLVKITAVRFRPPPLTLKIINMNMSYCRYENTSKQLQDCVYTLMDSDCSEDLSIHEMNGLKDLQLLAMDIVSMEDKIENIIENQKQRFVTN